MAEVEISHQAGGAAVGPAISAPSRRPSVLTRMEQKWTDIQVERQGAYSVEHLVSLDLYCKTTSRTRVVLVCVLSPLPALLTALMLECLPLQSPSNGWSANWVFWIRLLLVHVILDFLFNLMWLRFVPGLHFTFAKRLVKTAGSTILCVGTCILVACTVGFPVPFMMQFGAVPLGVYVMVMMRLVLGPAFFAKNSPLRVRVDRFNCFFAAVMALCAVFPVYKMLYMLLPVEYRAITIVILPIWKFAAQQFMANATRELEDYMPIAVTFSVDFFSTLFISVCASTSKSTSLKLLLVAADIGQSLLQFRAMRANGKKLFELLDERRNSRRLYPQQVDLLQRTDLQAILLDAIKASISFPPKSLVNVRLWACLPYPLTRENFEKLHALDAVDVYARPTEPRRGELCQVRNIRRPYCRILHVTSVAPSPAVNNAQLHKSGTSLSHTASSQEKVIQGLQLLFHAEYVVLVQYIEGVASLVYLVYKSTLENLPNVAFYPGGAGNWDTTSSANMFLFTVLEIGLLCVFNIFVERKFAFSPLHQLAFLLETEVYVVQPLFFGWFLSLLQYELEHFGGYFASPCSYYCNVSLEDVSHPVLVHSRR